MIEIANSEIKNGNTLPLQDIPVGINIHNVELHPGAGGKIARAAGSSVSISGIDGLYPTLKAIKFTKKIAIANKESIICGWSLINKKLKSHKTEFIPIDSEHFSINELIKNSDKSTIEKIYITASGGPFLKKKISSFKKIKVKNAINHPTWKMGKKISVDSATMINKVYELVEAKKIFDLYYSKLDILIQPTSYVHSLIKFKGGITKVLILCSEM